MGLFNVGHVAKLNEIQSARLSAGKEGIGPEVEDLIRSLEMGGINQRRIQVMHLWNKGVGRDPSVKARNVKEYLTGIPQIPESLIKADADLPLLSLADPRPGLRRSCRLLGIRFEELGRCDEHAVPFDGRFPVPTTPFWFRHDDGSKNQDRRPNYCRSVLHGDTQVGSAIEGVFAYTHHPQILKEDGLIIDLPGTVRHGDHALCAYLRVLGGQVELRLGRNSDIAGFRFGSMRLRRK